MKVENFILHHFYFLCEYFPIFLFKYHFNDNQVYDEADNGIERKKMKAGITMNQ